MSEGMNRVTLFGNLGADPELRFTGSGTAVLNMRMACTESYLDKDKQRQERTEWINVVVWGKRGEALAKFLTKGSQVLVEGGLRTSSFEKEGVKHYRTEVHANDVYLGGRGNGGGGERPAAASKGGQQTGGAGYGDDEYPND